VSAIETIAEAARSTGYRREAVLRDYAFADVLDPAATTRRVALAAFTQTPPSYRSAALGVVTDDKRDPYVVTSEYRALGAPILFIVSNDDVSVWQIRSATPPRIVTRLSVAQLPALFARNRDAWHPDAIHRAKSIGAVETEYQLDFVDAGLLPAIESEIHTKLDRLLREALRAASEADRKGSLDTRTLFRVVFRLLAAKVLQDRGHPYAQTWSPDDLASVLRAIESYYSLDRVSFGIDRRMSPAPSAVWNRLRSGISFSNISADDLAFVYENTLVTPETRRHFGTHSTPREVAEYVVRGLELHRHRPDQLQIYEPFAGAGVFLVSALRHLRDGLRIDWSDQQRHEFLVRHLAGDEIDAFAREVAILSLILADYPNQNGWKVGEANLFEADALDVRLRDHNVILCNPPFEDFTAEERDRYPIAKRTYSKPLAALDAVLNAHPLAVGFVLPRPFIRDRKFVEQRRRVEKLYGSVELVELPDRTFGASTIEAALLVAHEPRPPAPSIIALRSTEVADRDREAFLKTGKTTTQREAMRPLANPPAGDLWIPSLASLWRYLNTYPRLDDRLEIHRGIEWAYPQDQAWSIEEKSGYRLGLHNARQSRQFVTARPVWLDMRPQSIRRAFELPWTQPKLIVNAARLSRGPWRLATVFDVKGVVCSQQFFGLWPRIDALKSDLLSLSAVLNGPVANAFVAVHSPAKGIRVSAMKGIPIPPTLPARLAELVAEYREQLAENARLHQNDQHLARLLTQIDATVLEAYDLPPRLEAQLLDYFRDGERPVVHPWDHWDDSHPMPGLRLAERLSGRFHPKGNWIAEVFRPLPEREAALLRAFGE
jgi:N-6 DNA Methylase